MLADLDAYLVSPAFWIKMALVAALLVNGGGAADPAASAQRVTPRRIERCAIAARVSLVLWFVTTLAGAVLPNAL